MPVDSSTGFGSDYHSVDMPRLRKKNSKATKPDITRINKISEMTKGGPTLLLPKKSIETPRKKTLVVDMEKIKSLESNNGDSIFEFIPSKTSKIDDADQEHLVTSNIDLHIEALQKLIATRFNFVRNYEFLIKSAREVLRMIRCYIKDNKSPTFDWKWSVFKPPFRCRERYLLIPDPHGSVYICKLARNGRASVYPYSPGIVQMDFRPIALTLPLSNQKIPLGFCLSLNEKESKIWLEFKKLDKGNPESVSINSTFDEEEEKRSINLSYPLVSVIGDFAVAAFNKACATIKKDEHNKLHDFEYMECKYVKDTKDYFFYMTIEAIEEGNLGVYETIVVCSRDDGLRTLLKFVLTDRTPVGTKAMALSLFSCLRSLCKTLEDVKKEKARKLFRIHRAAIGTSRGKACSELALLSYFNDEIIKGIRRVLALNLQLLFQPDCTRTSDPGDWSLPDCCYNIGIVPRNNDMPCRGYDYDQYNQYLTGSGTWW